MVDSIAESPQTQLWPVDDQRAEAALLAICEDARLVEALLAIEGATASQRAATEAQIDSWASAVRLAVKAAPHCPATGAGALREVLVAHGNLRGDAGCYDAAENSLIAAVVERRLGQPVLLSSLWIEVGRRAGVAVAGVGLPGHFIARVGGPSGIYVDPFCGGRVLTDRQCRKIVEDVSKGTLPWHDDYLATASTHEIVQRVLRNLMRARRAAADQRGMYRAVRFYAALRPDDVEAALVHARMAEEIGASRLAADLYTALIARFPTSHEAVVAERRLSPLHLVIQALH